MSRKQVVYSSDHVRSLVITYKNGKKWHEKLKEGSSVVVWRDRKSGAYHVTYGIQVTCKNEEGLEFKHHESTTTPPIAAIEVTEKWADGAKVTYKSNYALVRPKYSENSEEVFTVTDNFEPGVVYTCVEDSNANQLEDMLHFKSGDKFKWDATMNWLIKVPGDGSPHRAPVKSEPIKVKVLNEDQ